MTFCGQNFQVEVPSFVIEFSNISFFTFEDHSVSCQPDVPKEGAGQGIPDLSSCVVCFFSPRVAFFPYV